MSDKENLLNNLKIDRSAQPAADGPPSNKLYLLGVAIVLVSFFWWLFLSEDELKEVTTFTVNVVTSFSSSFDKNNHQKKLTNTMAAPSK